MIYNIGDLSEDTLELYSLQENDFLYVNNEELYRLRNGNLSPIKPNKKLRVKPLNEEQQAFRNVFEDDQVKIINLFGPAGAGKSFCTLGSALEAVLDKEQYSRILIVRELVPATKFNMGFRPGNEFEKISPMFGAIYDTIESLSVKTSGLVDCEDPVGFTETLIRQGIIQFTTLETLRGRNFRDTLIIADDGQNLSVDNIRLVMTRLSDNSKIIFNGDLSQIDNNRMDGIPGMQYVDNICKGYPEYARIDFTHSECRSGIVGKFIKWEKEYLEWAN